MRSSHLHDAESSTVFVLFPSVPCSPTACVNGVECSKNLHVFVFEVTNSMYLAVALEF